MFGFNWMNPGQGDKREPSPPDPSRVRRVRCILIIVAIAALLAVIFWRDALFGILVYLFYIFLFLHFPVSAFACLAAIVFAVGWYLCPWPNRSKGKRWWPASMVLAVVVVLHAGWFLFGWVAFYPSCSYDPGPGPDTGRRTLVGELNPVFADAMERGLRGTWGDAAVRRADEHRVHVRPVFGLLASKRHAEMAFFPANGSGMPGALVDSETGCQSVERKVMRNGQAIEWRYDWGLWPWNTIDEDGAFARWLRGLYKDT